MRTDLEILVIALAPDLDPRFERLFAYLQDDVTRRRPAIGLALELCRLSPWSFAARDRLAPAGPLLSGGLLRVEDPDRPILTRHLRVEDRVISHLLGSDVIDPSIRRLVVQPSAVSVDDGGPLVDALDRGVGFVYLRERIGSAASAVAASALSTTGTAVVCLDLERMGTDDDPFEVVVAAVREARLRGAGLIAGPIDGLTDRSVPAMGVLADAPCSVVLIGRVAWQPRWSSRAPWTADAPVPSATERERLWDSGAAEERAGDVGSRMAAFRLSPEQIQRAISAALIRARAAGRTPTLSDLQAGARAENAAGLDRLARRVEPRATWADLVVPQTVRAHLTELVARARRRDIVIDEWGMGGGATRGRGITALFAGDPGTGKTLSAEVVAADLGLDLYVIDLSSVVDKYIGETEKNLDRIFTEADRINGVLLFDEADALFGQRSEVRDARDRYANVEIAYLLQRMEQFDGLAILTTNLRANIDEAFLRRLDAVVDFPMPEDEGRLAIWRLHLPERVPQDDDIDLGFMASRFRLSGGHIRNICVTAAFLAADRDGRVTMSDIIRATEREYAKLGRLTVEAEFGSTCPSCEGRAVPEEGLAALALW